VPCTCCGHTLLHGELAWAAQHASSCRLSSWSHVWQQPRHNLAASWQVLLLKPVVSTTYADNGQRSLLLLLLRPCVLSVPCAQVHVDTPMDTCRAWNAARPAPDSYNTDV
jgi:hypothetical protein